MKFVLLVFGECPYHLLKVPLEININNNSYYNNKTCNAHIFTLLGVPWRSETKTKTKQGQKQTKQNESLKTCDMR